MRTRKIRAEENDLKHWKNRRKRNKEKEKDEIRIWSSYAQNNEELVFINLRHTQ